MNRRLEYDYLNSIGERVQIVGDIYLNLEYWDCECKDDFIHSINIQFCPKCGSNSEEGPSSRENEILGYFGRDLNKNINQLKS